MLAQLPPHRVGRLGGDTSSAPSPPRGEARRGYQLRSLPIARGGQEGMLAQLAPHRVRRLGGDTSSAPSPSRGEARRGCQLSSLPTAWGGEEGMPALLSLAGHDAV